MIIIPIKPEIGDIAKVRLPMILDVFGRPLVEVAKVVIEQISYSYNQYGVIILTGSNKGQNRFFVKERIIQFEFGGITVQYLYDEKWCNQNDMNRFKKYQKEGLVK